MPLSEKRKEHMRNYHKNVWYPKNKEKHMKMVKRAERKRLIRYKKELVEMFGGKCEKCGYNKSIAALQFHHHKGDKKFNISYLLKKKGWNYIKEEAKKCKLLCANCHAELHWDSGERN